MTEGPAIAELRERHAQLLERLRQAAESGGHDPERLRIVAVTKGHPIAVARAALEAGLTRLGESRLQEAEPKIAELPDAEWHFIGRLQSNKVRRVARTFPIVHSVGSVDLLRRLDRIAVEEKLRPRILLQVNLASEPTKAGFGPDGPSAAEIRASRCEVIGLMTIAPMGAGTEAARTIFAGLRRMRERLEEEAGVGLPELSMGMSADADAAAAEGATLIRIGTSLFGPRG